MRHIVCVYELFVMLPNRQSYLTVYNARYIEMMGSLNLIA